MSKSPIHPPIHPSVRPIVEDNDHATSRFLDLLADDLDGKSPNAAPLSRQMMERMKVLTEGVEVDLDAPIEGDVDL